MKADGDYDLIKKSIKLVEDTIELHTNLVRQIKSLDDLAVYSKGIAERAKELEAE